MRRARICSRSPRLTDAQVVDPTDDTTGEKKSKKKRKREAAEEEAVEDVSSSKKDKKKRRKGRKETYSSYIYKGGYFAYRSYIWR